MKGEEAEGDVAAGSVDVGSGERTSSVMKLQNMLLNASHNPFLKDGFLDSKSPDLGGPSANQQKKEQGDLHLWPQNGVSARSNPFYTYYLESSRQSPLEETNKRKMSGSTNPAKNLFVRPPELQSSTLDLSSKMKTLPNGVKLPESFTSSQTFSQEDHTFPPSSLGSSTDATDAFLDGILKSSEFSSPNAAVTQNLSNSWDVDSSDVVKNKDHGPSRALKTNNLIQTGRHNQDNLFEPPQAFKDPFESPLNTGHDLFQSPQGAPVNPFSSSAASKDDGFQAAPSDDLFQVKVIQTEEQQLLRSTLKGNVDLFPSTSTNPDDVFPSPLSRNLFHDFSLDEPFDRTPSEPDSLRRDALDDIFLPYSSKDKNRSTFDDTSNESPSPSTHSLTNVPTLLLKKVPPPIQPKPVQKPTEIVLTSPQGSKLDVLQPSPLIQARSLSPSPTPPEMTHVSTIKRPPIPLPRSKPPRPEKPPQLDKLPSPTTFVNSEPEAPTQLIRRAFKSVRKPSFARRTPERKPLDPNDFVVLDDILLIGEEKCVEDWPEDSPELDPEWKPSGKLKLRRDTLRMKQNVNGDEDQDQAEDHMEKKDKARMSVLSKRGSKEKIVFKGERKSSTLQRKYSRVTEPEPRTQKQEFQLYSTDQQTSGEQNQEEDSSSMDYRKKNSKSKVGHLFRRASSAAVMSEGKQWDGQEFKDLKKRDTITRRWSEGKMLEASSGEEEEEGSAQHGERKKRLKIKFIPQRGYAISLEKLSSEPKGAQGFTPRKNSKEQSEDLRHSNNHTPDGIGQAAAMDPEDLQRRGSPGPDASYKPKKNLKSRRSSKVNTEDSAEDEEVDGPDKSKTKHFKGKRKSKTTNTASESSECSSQRSEPACAEGFAEEDLQDEDYDDFYKPKKPSKMKGYKKGRRKSKSKHQQGKDLAGAAGNQHLSEAAKAEWLAAQRDGRTIAGEDEDEDEDGDTDSLMEWWYTVEKWDEVLSDEEDAAAIKDETKSFTILADKVDRGLRVFNKIFTERAELLWHSVIMLHTLADDISDFHHKAKIAGITGGTTTAVGGIAAIAGLALAPFTLGTSLVITAVGAGVAAAGGITSASAAISDNVNNTNERKKMEVLLKEYEDQLEDIANIIHFVNQGLYRLRGHPFLRSGTQHYSQEWEIRRAVQMISMVDSPVMKATDVVDKAVSSLQSLFKGMDKYFVKDSRELKKGCRKEVVGRIREVAGVLNDSVVDLNAFREELQEAIGLV